MKRIGNSKEPTEKQINSMISNLRKKHPEDSFNISMEAWHYRSGNTKLTYRLYSDTRSYITEEVSWPKLLIAYRKLIREDSSVS